MSVLTVSNMAAENTGSRIQNPERKTKVSLRAAFFCDVLFATVRTAARATKSAKSADRNQ
jgi:hypothetical protein